MINTDYIKKLIQNGFSVFPLNRNKEPNFKKGGDINSYSWQDFNCASNPFPVNTNTESLFIYLGIACGKSSKNLEVIDVDCKYQLDQDLWKEFSDLLKDNLEVFDKLCVVKTVNNGYHIMYRCETIEGNLKLAQRNLSKDEKNKHYLNLINDGVPKEKAINQAKSKKLTLIETRGEGGYVATFPSDGYTIIQGDFFNIPLITDEERDIIMCCAKAMCVLEEEEVIPTKTVKLPVWEEGKKPWEAYNEQMSGEDMASLFLSNGYTITRRIQNKIFLRRPGGKSQSGNIRTDLKLFVAHSSNTPFEQGRGYNASGVFTVLECNSDFSVSAKKLLELGYGDKPKKKLSNDFEILSDSFKADSFKADVNKNRELIERFINGDFGMGLSTGYDMLDEYYRFKLGKFDVFLGNENIGKSTILWYLCVVANVLHGWRSIIYSTENDAWVIQKQMMEFFVGKKMSLFTDREKELCYKWFDDNFVLIDNEKLLAYNQILQVAEYHLLKKEYHILMIDPYNTLTYNWEGLDRRMGMHEYHHHVATQFKQWSKNMNCSIWLNMHPNSESMRTVESSGEYKGMRKAPLSSHAEGGGKWVAKADNFIVLHRYTKHVSDYNMTLFDVQKVKETFTGGRPMTDGSVYKLKLTNYNGFVGFFDEFNNNPLLGKFKKMFNFGEQMQIEVEPPKFTSRLTTRWDQMEIKAPF
jgi:hypothetical protein